MKTKIIMSALVLLSTSVVAHNCPTPDGHWVDEEQYVRVCDYSYENYTESQRICDYRGSLDLVASDYIRYPPVYGSSTPGYDSRTLDVAMACPASLNKSQSDFYRYRDRATGQIGSRLGTFSGLLPLTSDRVNSQTKTRTIESNCRHELRIVQVWRCAVEP